VFKNNKKTSTLVLGSKEDKYSYMVERLGVTGDAGGVGVLVFFTFTPWLTSPSPFLSPQVNAPFPCIHPLIRLAHWIRERSFPSCTIKRNGGFRSTGGYHGGVGAWIGVFGDDTEDVDEVWQGMG